MEQLCFLCYEALHIAQVAGVDPFDVPARKGYFAALYAPKAHQQLEQCGFAAAAFAGNAYHRVLRYVNGHVIEDRLLSIGEAHMPDDRTVKADRRLPFDVPDRGLLIQNVQHAVSGRECVLQGAAQRGQRNHRAKGRKQRNGGNQHTRITDLPGPVQGCAAQEHCQVKCQNGGARSGVVPPGDALHPRFRLRKCVRTRVHLRQTPGTLAILLRLAQAAQAVQHKRAQLTRLGAKNQPAVAAAAGCRQRNRNAYHSVSGQGKQPQRRVKGADERAHDHGKQRRDGQRGKGVRVKDLQQLDV